MPRYIRYFIWGRDEVPPPPPESRGGALFRGFLCRLSRYNEVQFYCGSAGRLRALSLPISNEECFDLSNKPYVLGYNKFNGFNTSSRISREWVM